MTDPTPPRAPDAVPEAVWDEIRDALNEMESACYDEDMRDVRESRRVIRAAIATVLREATETRDQEIARLTTELERACNDTDRAANAHEQERRNVQRLKANIEAERSAAARIFDKLRREIAARRPLSQGRECYEWDDDRYRQEFGYALDGIEKIVQDMERACRIYDLTDCPLHWDDVQGAREIARLTAELAAAKADTARLDGLATQVLWRPRHLTLHCYVDDDDGNVTVTLKLPGRGEVANTGPAPTALDALRVVLDAAPAVGEDEG